MSSGSELGDKVRRLRISIVLLTFLPATIYYSTQIYLDSGFVHWNIGIVGVGVLFLLAAIFTLYKDWISFHAISKWRRLKHKVDFKIWEGLIILIPTILASVVIWHTVDYEQFETLWGLLVGMITLFAIFIGGSKIVKRVHILNRQEIGQQGLESQKESLEWFQNEIADKDPIWFHQFVKRVYEGCGWEAKNTNFENKYYQKFVMEYNTDSEDEALENLIISVQVERVPDNLKRSDDRGTKVADIILRNLDSGYDCVTIISNGKIAEAWNDLDILVWDRRRLKNIWDNIKHELVNEPNEDNGDEEFLLTPPTLEQGISRLLDRHLLYSEFGYLYEVIHISSFTPKTKQRKYIDEYVSDEDRILDVGCGTGQLLRDVLSDYEVQAKGIDTGSSMIEVARDYHGISNVTGSDVRNFDLPYKSYDVIVAFRTLTYIVDINADSKKLDQMLINALEQIRDHMHPNGTLIIDNLCIDYEESNSTVIHSESYSQTFGSVEIKVDEQTEIACRERGLINWVGEYNVKDPNSEFTRTKIIKENHIYRALKKEEFIDLVTDAGFDVDSDYDVDSDNTDLPIRKYIIAAKPK